MISTFDMPCENCTAHGIKRTPSWTKTQIAGYRKCNYCHDTVDRRATFAEVNEVSTMKVKLVRIGERRVPICTICNKEISKTRPQAEHRAFGRDMRAYFNRECGFYHISGAPEIIRPKAIYAHAPA